MDPRTQRWLLLVLLFTVAFVLYRDLGSGDAPHSNLASSSITTESPDDGRQGYIAADPLAANSTLGVCLSSIFTNALPTNTLTPLD